MENEEEYRCIGCGYNFCRCVCVCECESCKRNREKNEEYTYGFIEYLRKCREYDFTITQARVYLSEQLLPAQRKFNNRGVIVIKEDSDVVEDFIPHY